MAASGCIRSSVPAPESPAWEWKINCRRRPRARTSAKASLTCSSASSNEQGSTSLGAELARQHGEELPPFARVDPAAAIPAEVMAALARGQPKFVQRGLGVDDDLAAAR